jgi:hypothetical protein
MLEGGRPRSPSNTLRERGASILRSTNSPPLVVRHARDGHPGAFRVRPRGRVESWWSTHPIGELAPSPAGGYRSMHAGAKNLLLATHESPTYAQK